MGGRDRVRGRGTAKPIGVETSLRAEKQLPDQMGKKMWRRELENGEKPFSLDSRRGWEIEEGEVGGEEKTLKRIMGSYSRASTVFILSLHFGGRGKTGCVRVNNH